MMEGSGDLRLNCNANCSHWQSALGAPFAVAGVESANDEFKIWTPAKNGFFEEKTCPDVNFNDVVEQVRVGYI